MPCCTIEGTFLVAVRFLGCGLEVECFFGIRLRVRLFCDLNWVLWLGLIKECCGRVNSLFKGIFA